MIKINLRFGRHCYIIRTLIPYYNCRNIPIQIKCTWIRMNFVRYLNNSNAENCRPILRNMTNHPRCVLYDSYYETTLHVLKDF